MSRARRVKFSLFTFSWYFGEEPDPQPEPREVDLGFASTERLPEEAEMEGNVKGQRGVGFARNGEKRAFEQ